MVGKTFRSKVNGDEFCIDKEYTDNGLEWFSVRHIKSGKCTQIEKGWFLHGYMKNLEIIERN